MIPYATLREVHMSLASQNYLSVRHGPTHNATCHLESVKQPALAGPNMLIQPLPCMCWQLASFHAVTVATCRMRAATAPKPSASSVSNSRRLCGSNKRHLLGTTSTLAASSYSICQGLPCSGSASHQPLLALVQLLKVKLLIAVSNIGNLWQLASTTAATLAACVLPQRQSPSLPASQTTGGCVVQRTASSWTRPLH